MKTPERRRTPEDVRAPAAKPRPFRIERKTITDLVLDALRNKILHGDYTEGAALRQDALAAEFGVSRIPVREALRQLEAEGLVAFNPHTGAVVSTLSLAEIEELFELRALLESEIVGFAVPLLTEEDLDRAEAILDAYEAAFEQRDITSYGPLNWQFHSTLLSAANRPLTLGVLSNLHNRGDRYTRMQLALTHGETRAVDEHRAILAFARARNAKAASKLVREHVESAGRSLTEFLREHRMQTDNAAAQSGKRR